MRPKIKICGLTRECDIDYINEAGPEYIGFVFAQSKRQVDTERAVFLKSKIKPGIETVGVFVNAPPEHVCSLVNRGTIDIVQLHGHETPSYVERIKKLTSAPLIKAVRMGEETYRSLFFEEYKNAGIDYFLLDSASAAGSSGYGGTGITFNWGKIPEMPLPYFLAGGLNAGNIREAARVASPYAVDISSGAETGGVKDRDKILEIIRRVRDV